MNFFQQQERARRHSRWLIGAFLGVTVIIILVIDALVLLLLGAKASVDSSGLYAESLSLTNTFSSSFISQNAELLSISSAVVAGIIALASLFKITMLRAGGAKVAADLGGTLVTADTRDPLKRRLYNVVEEIAIASGTPVPDVFVMESEPGINAFAAGYGTADAAVAVTQGTLEKLNRAELQGVIAHEFSHIFNGDMRINIRLMGIIFGIMVIALIGRKFLNSTRYASSSRDNKVGGIIAVGLALIVVGYVGLFFARWMKSALSRQREYLADASAVQFTRDPDGIAGALKKIAAYNHATYLRTDSEEVSHMLFGSGTRALLFATHPPIEKRIERIEKKFDEKEISALAEKLKRQDQREHLQADAAQKEQNTPNTAKRINDLINVDEIIDNIGNPDLQRITAAALFADTLNDSLKHAAHSTEWSPEVLLYALLDADDELREQQMLVVTKEMGDLSESKIRHLVAANGLVGLDERLPLLEIAFPSIKRRPIGDIEKIVATADKMALVDQRIDTFEYLLSRLIKQTIFEAHLPNRTRLHGKKRLKNCIDELTLVVSTLAAHGQNSTSAQGLQDAQKSFTAGMGAAGIGYKNLSFTEKWHQGLDKALKTIDRLTAKDKAVVVKALATTVLHDQKLITAEQEMMRVICALIHVPMPLLQSAK